MNKIVNEELRERGGVGRELTESEEALEADGTSACR